MMSEMRKMHTSEIFEALLCDPNGKVVIHGSDKDRQLLEEAIKEVKVLEKKAGRIEKVGVEELAKFMHVEYEKQAIKVGWNTQDSCKVDFDDLPEKNKQVMLAVAKAILNNLKEKE